MTRRKHQNDLKTEQVESSRISIAVTHVLAIRGPALRWHEFTTGWHTERENLHSQCQGKRANGTHVSSKVPMCEKETDLPVVAVKVLKSTGAKGQGHSATPKRPTVREESF